MRLFVAIELDEPFRKSLVEVQETMRAAAPQVSFTRPENLHLTLKFIGEIADDAVKGLCDALGSVPRTESFSMRYTGLELLPERGPIRILAAAVDGEEKLLMLQRAIEEECATQKIPRGNRPFRPHITLARARNPLPRSARAKLASLADAAVAAEMHVGEVVLMMSKLSNKGSQYTVLYKIAV